MKQSIKSIDLDELSKLFTYNDGNLYSKRTGKKAGTIRKEGYIVIQINKIQYYSHRLIWTMFNGDIPLDKCIDHINRNKSDNRLENLRIVSNRENALNKPNRLSNTGIYGVSKDRVYYKVSFTIDKKSVHVGNFKDLSLAKQKADEFLKSMNK